MVLRVAVKQAGGGSPGSFFRKGGAWARQHGPSTSCVFLLLQHSIVAAFLGLALGGLLTCIQLGSCGGCLLPPIIFNALLVTTWSVIDYLVLTKIRPIYFCSFLPAS